MHRLGLSLAALCLATATAGATVTATAGATTPPPAGHHPGHHSGHHDPHPTEPVLSGWAVLAADTFVPGSAPSGYFTGSPAAPYPGQPVQGFSGVHRLADGSYLAMSDNGFGSKANSQDFLLRVHRIKPSTRRGTVEVRGGFNLSDPWHRVPFTTWRDGGCQGAASLPAGYSCPPRDRLLTGWDLDIESMQVAPDGTIWFGEEFGPFLLHADARGRLLEAPLATPGVTSPSNPTLGAGEQPNLANSKGFEGTAITPDGTGLRAMLEGPVAGDPATDLRVYDVRLSRTGDRRRPTRFTGDYDRYRLEAADHAIGDHIAVNRHQFLTIERDNGSGPTARFKRVYLVDDRDRDRDGYLDKSLLVDLMDLANPRGVGGFADPFTFPYVTIEDVELVDADTIAVLNDNNYPGTGGRGAGVKDVNEYLEIDLPTPLRVDHRLLARG